jgi:hypothetical protein
MWKWASQHNKLLLYEPRGFLKFWAQVGKVIIFTNFTWKLHLPLLFLFLTNIIIRFLIIIVILGFIIIISIPTLTIITSSFICVPFGLLVAVWVRRLYIMHICRLSGGGRSHSFSYYKLVKRQIFQLVHHQVCSLIIFRAYDVISMRPRIFSMIIIRPRCVKDNLVNHPRLRIYEILRSYYGCINILPNVRQ